MGTKAMAERAITATFLGKEIEEALASQGSDPRAAYRAQEALDRMTDLGLPVQDEAETRERVRLAMEGRRRMAP